MTYNFLAETFAADPLLIDPARVAVVSAALQAIAASDADTQRLLDASATASAGDSYWDHPYQAGEPHPYRPYSVANGTLSIPVNGVLLNQFSFQFGRWATGYQYVEKALARGMADPDVKRIALVVNSPGGEVAGCFECADKIYGARGEKPIRAFAADYAYSAAYALASSAGDLSVTRSGGTGSVGVVTTHVDFSEALANEGIKVTFIFAGKHKVEGNAYEALSDWRKTVFKTELTASMACSPARWPAIGVWMRKRFGQPRRSRSTLRTPWRMVSLTGSGHWKRKWSPSRRT